MRERSRARGFGARAEHRCDATSSRRSRDRRGPSPPPPPRSAAAEKRCGTRGGGGVVTDTPTRRRARSRVRTDPGSEAVESAVPRPRSSRRVAASQRRSSPIPSETKTERESFSILAVLLRPRSAATPRGRGRRQLRKREIRQADSTPGRAAILVPAATIHRTTRRTSARRWERPTGRSPPPPPPPPPPPLARPRPTPPLRADSSAKRAPARA